MRKGKNNRLLKGVLVCETIAIIALLAVLILWINRPADVAKDQPQYALAEGSAESQPNEVSAEEPSSTPPPVEESSQVEEIPEARMVLGAVGDIMFHEWQLTRAYRGEDSFDFTDSFSAIAPQIQEADFAVANLETVFAGQNQGNPTSEKIYGYSSYPCFNTPSQAAVNIRDAGFDFLGTANNHSLDASEKGLLSTLEVLRQAGIPSTGSYSEVDAPRASVQEVNGFRLGFLAYTYGANGFTLPADRKGLLNMLEDYDADKINAMYQETEKLAESGEADLVIVMMHFGTEYQYTPNSTQEEMVDRLFEAGADIILGSHPHVLQPFEVREIPNGDGTTRQGFVIYSLGNFISSQYYTEQRPYYKELGVYIQFQLSKRGDEKPIIESVSLMPTYVQWKDEYIRVVPVELAIDSYQSGENTYALTSSDHTKITRVQQFFQMSFWPEEYPYTLNNGYYVVNLAEEP